MDVIFYNELREKNNEIRDMRQSMSSEDLEHEEKRLVDTIQNICMCSDVARKEGLLVLEEYASNPRKYNVPTYIAPMLMFVINAYEPERIVRICLSRYFADNMRAYDGLAYLLCMQGVLLIQKGERIYFIKETLLSMLPSDVVDKYKETQAIRSEYEMSREFIDNQLGMTLVDWVCDQEPLSFSGAPEYYAIGLCNHLIMNSDDMCLQRVIRAIDNHTLAHVLTVVSKEAKRLIFNNVSKRLADMIAEEVKYNTHTSISDIRKATNYVLKVYFELLSNAEIGSNGDTDIEELLRIFQSIQKCEDEQTSKLHFLQERFQKINGVYYTFL